MHKIFFSLRAEWEGISLGGTTFVSQEDMAVPGRYCGSADPSSRGLAMGRHDSQFCLLPHSLNSDVQPFGIVIYNCVSHIYRSAGAMPPAGWRLDMSAWWSGFF